MALPKELSDRVKYLIDKGYIVPDETEFIERSEVDYAFVTKTWKLSVSAIDALEEYENHQKEEHRNKREKIYQSVFTVLTNVVSALLGVLFSWFFLK